MLERPRVVEAGVDERHDVVARVREATVRPHGHLVVVDDLVPPDLCVDGRVIWERENMDIGLKHMGSNVAQWRIYVSIDSAEI